MKISIETIPHNQQRYNTVGDWTFDHDGNLNIKVSEMGNENYEFLVAQHELTEAWLCKKNGITEKEVDEFDIEFEAKRAIDNYDEPGDDLSCPYNLFHSFATGIERLLATYLNIKWKEYDNCVNRL
jgi:hypothetical protein